MANISVNNLLTVMQARFKTTGVEGFSQIFLTALRQAVAQINVDADLETRITAPTTTEGTIALDEAYEYVVIDLLIIRLWILGQGIRKDDDGAFIAQLRRDVPEEIDMIRQDILNQARDDDDDDEDDLVGLGALG